MTNSIKVIYNRIAPQTEDELFMEPEEEWETTVLFHDEDEDVYLMVFGEDAPALSLLILEQGSLWKAYKASRRPSVDRPKSQWIGQILFVHRAASEKTMSESDRNARIQLALGSKFMQTLNKYEDLNKYEEEPLTLMDY